MCRDKHYVFSRNLIQDENSHGYKMANLTITFVCLQIFIQISAGNSVRQYERDSESRLKNVQSENHVKIVKRSSSNDNEIGGNNNNGKILTTTESNFIQYSAPNHGVSDAVNVKLMSTVSVNEDEEQSGPDPSGADIVDQSQAGGNHTHNNYTDGSVGDKTNDINSTDLSGTVDTTTNNATTKLPSAGDAGSISNKQHAITSENQSKNITTDNFITPVDYTHGAAENINSENVTHSSNTTTTTTVVSNIRGGADQTLQVTMTTNTDKSNSGTSVESQVLATTVQSVFESPTESLSNQTQMPLLNGVHSGNSSHGGNVIAGVSETSSESNIENNGSITDLLKPSATQPTSPGNITSNSDLQNDTDSYVESEPIPEPEPVNTTANPKVTTNTNSISTHTTSKSVPFVGVNNNTQNSMDSSNIYDNSTKELTSTNAANVTKNHDITTKPSSFSNNVTELSSLISIIQENTTTSTGATTSTRLATSLAPDLSGTAEPEAEISSPATYPEPDDTNATTSTSSKMPASTESQNITSKTLSTRTFEVSSTTDSHNTVQLEPEPEISSPKPKSTTNTVINSTTYYVNETNDTNNGSKIDSSPEPEDDDSDPESESEPENSDEGKFNTDVFAEPGPDWKVAKDVWRGAWAFHIYFFGIAFALLGIYSVLSLIRLWNIDHMLTKHYFITLLLLVILVCILRTLYLLIDAYNSLGTYPLGLDYFLYSSAFPCLTALFSILFYSLLLATRVQALSKKVQKLWVLVLIITIHFVLSITTDIVVGLYASASILIFICQSFFIIWGLFMFIGYLVMFRKLYKGAMNRKKLMLEQKKNMGDASLKARYTIGLAVKVTFVSAIFGLAIAGFQLYGMFGVYGVLKVNVKPEPWPWWTYHTIVRTFEILMCVTVAYVASQPFRYKMKKHLKHRVYNYLVPCCLCCCPGNFNQSKAYSSTTSLDYVMSDTDHFNMFKKSKKKKHITPEVPYPPHTAEKYSDPDATLLVRKVRRNSKPSMLVVENGFVRIRLDDEIQPSNQYELDSESSHSSETNFGPGSQRTRGVTNKADFAISHEIPRGYKAPNATGINFDNYILQGNVPRQLSHSDVNVDDTDIDIVVTDSELDDDDQELEETVVSNKSADIFRPLSMIDLATSMESELDRAFNTSCVEETDLISHNSLPAACDGSNTDWDECAYNEYLCDKYSKIDTDDISNQGSAAFSSDSTEEQGKSSAVQLLRPRVRRSKSDDSKSSSPKYKHFEKNRYYSVSDVDSIGKDDDFNTHLGSDGELRTEL